MLYHLECRQIYSCDLTLFVETLTPTWCLTNKCLSLTVSHSERWHRRKKVWKQPLYFHLFTFDHLCLYLYICTSKSWYQQIQAFQKKKKNDLKTEQFVKSWIRLSKNFNVLKVYPEPPKKTDRIFWKMGKEAHHFH